MAARKKIPDHARLVFKGEIFEVWQWQQEMYDGSTRTFERLRRPDTVVIIPVLGDTICIVDEEQPDMDPYVSVPAGRSEAGEEPLVAARRELKEETGLESDDWELLAENEPASKIDWTVHTFIARNCKKTTEQALDGGEKITPSYVSYEEFLSLTENPKFAGGGLSKIMLTARLDEKSRVELHTKLFGN